MAISQVFVLSCACTTTTIHYKSNHKSTYMNYALLLFLPSFCFSSFHFSNIFRMKNLNRMCFLTHNQRRRWWRQKHSNCLPHDNDACHTSTHSYIYIHPLPSHTPHTSLSPVCALMFSQSLSLSLCACHFLVLSPRPFCCYSRPCAARVFINILRPFGFLFPSPFPFLFLYSLQFFCFFISYIFNTFFSRLCLCFLCAFCVALTARAINFNCAFYALHSHLPSYFPLPTHSSLCCLLFCFIMQKKSTGCCLFCALLPRLV